MNIKVNTKVTETIWWVLLSMSGTLLLKREIPTYSRLSIHSLLSPSVYLIPLSAVAKIPGF